MQPVIPREAYCTMHLVRDRSTDARRFARTTLTHSHRLHMVRVTECTRRQCGGRIGGSSLRGKYGDLLLDRLLLADRPTELDSISRIRDRHRDDLLESTSHLERAHHGTSAAHGIQIQRTRECA
jgi:hypothetical protein